MALLDVLDVLGIFDVLSWRSFLPTVAGIGAGLVVYYLAGQTPASAAVAFALGLTGIGIGLVWEYSHRRRR